MDWYEAEVRALEQALDCAPPPSGAVVFYGSSSIRLWQTLADDFADVALLNLGFGGATLAACAHFFERLVAPTQPRSLVFYAGDNDLGDGQPADEVLGSLDRLLGKLDERLGPIPFGFISIKPSPARRHLWPAIQAVNAAARARMAERRASVYIDVYAPMLAADGEPRAELFADDGLHLSEAGYRLWAAQVGVHAPQIF
jgi:lysophospholipase L1-like esterase